MVTAMVDPRVKDAHSIHAPVLHGRLSASTGEGAGEGSVACVRETQCMRTDPNGKHRTGRPPAGKSTAPSTDGEHDP